MNMPSDYRSAYQSPGVPSRPPASDPGERPRVWPWYVAYCVAMALLYVAVVVGGALLFIFANEILAEQSRHDDMDPRIMGVILLIVGGPLAVFFGVAPFLTGRTAWIVGIVAIGIGMTSADRKSVV